jgi:aerobic carbon-monoxide dehydrogenase large subunit
LVREGRPRERRRGVTAWIGRSVPRREDLRLITGRGRYTDDLAPRNALHACFLRSFYPHARIVAIDVAVATGRPGVRAVLTAADYAADGHGPIKHLPNPADAIDLARPAFESRPGHPVIETYQPPLATGVVRYAGEAVVMVVATSAAAARDALEFIDVTYERLPAVSQSRDAVAPGAPQLFAEVPGNVVFDLDYGDAAATDAALANADVVIAHEFVNQRVIAAYMEPRAAFASYDAATSSYTITAASQGVMRHRAAAAGALGVPLERVHYITPDTGGGFGARNNIHVEPVLVAWAARRLGRPVRWTSDRSEGFNTDYHGRDMVVRVTMGLGRDGSIRAMRYDDLGNIGAYTVSFASLQNVVRIATGPYHVPAAHVRVRGVLTNTTPTSPYRGAGRPEIVHAFERMLDIAAERLGLDRIVIRERNLIRPHMFPYHSPLGLIYDCGDFLGNMKRVVERAGWAGFAERRSAAEAAGLLRGIGVANYLETPVGAPRERVTVSVLPGGAVEIIAGTQSNGQGHETTFAQVTADLLDVPFDTITLRTGDTDFVASGGGTHSNRSMRLVGTLLVEVCEALRERARDLGQPDVRAAAAVLSGRGETLSASADIARRIPAFPTGAAVCEVEIDPRTGAITIVRYTSVDDAGLAINPMIVDGQTHGGIAQGIGQALFERIVFDAETGQLTSANFMEYAAPRAFQVPSYDLELAEDRTAGNPLGIKGGGEAGVTPSPAGIINAVCDALRPWGVTDIDMPATPEKVWRAIHRNANIQVVGV